MVTDDERDYLWRTYAADSGLQYALLLRSRPALSVERQRCRRVPPRYEALSEALVSEGLPCGWHTWPDGYRSRGTGCPARTEARHRLSRQVWRLTHWRAGREMLTHRRFFEITDLVGLKVEQSQVFDESMRA